MSNASRKRKSSIKSCIAMHRKVKSHQAHHFCRKRLVFGRKLHHPDTRKPQSGEEVKKKKKFRAHERPALRHGRKTMRSVEICSTSFAQLGRPITQCCRRAKAQARVRSHDRTRALLRRRDDFGSRRRGGSRSRGPRGSGRASPAPRDAIATRDGDCVERLGVRVVRGRELKFFIIFF